MSEINPLPPIIFSQPSREMERGMRTKTTMEINAMLISQYIRSVVFRVLDFRVMLCKPANSTSSARVF
jgi:hypothetical protein